MEETSSKEETVYPILCASKFYQSPIFHSFLISSLAIIPMIYFLWNEYSANVALNLECLMMRNKKFNNYHYLQLSLHRNKMKLSNIKWFSINELENILKKSECQSKNLINNDEVARNEKLFQIGNNIPTLKGRTMKNDKNQKPELIIELYEIELSINLYIDKKRKTATPNYQAIIGYSIKMRNYKKKLLTLNIGENVFLSSIKYNDILTSEFTRGKNELNIKISSMECSIECDLHLEITVTGSMSHKREGLFYFDYIESYRNSYRMVIGDFTTKPLSTFIPCIDSNEQQSAFQLKMKYLEASQYYNIGDETFWNRKCFNRSKILNSEFTFAILPKSFYLIEEELIDTCYLKIFHPNTTFFRYVFDKRRFVETFNRITTKENFQSTGDIFLIILPYRKSFPSISRYIAFVDIYTSYYDFSNGTSHRELISTLLLAQTAISMRFYKTFIRLRKEDVWFYKAVTLYLAAKYLDPTNLIMHIVSIDTLIKNKKYSYSPEVKKLNTIIKTTMFFYRLEKLLTECSNNQNQLDKIILSLTEISSKSIFNLFVEEIGKCGVRIEEILCCKIFNQNYVLSLRNTQIRLFRDKDYPFYFEFCSHSENSFYIMLNYTISIENQSKHQSINKIDLFLSGHNWEIYKNFTDNNEHPDTITITEAGHKNVLIPFDITFDNRLYRLLIKSIFQEIILTKDLKKMVNIIDAKFSNNENWNAVLENEDNKEHKFHYKMCKSLNFMIDTVDMKHRRKLNDHISNCFANDKHMRDVLKKMLKNEGNYYNNLSLKIIRSECLYLLMKMKGLIENKNFIKYLDHLYSKFFFDWNVEEVEDNTLLPHMLFNKLTDKTQHARNWKDIFNRYKKDFYKRSSLLNEVIGSQLAQSITMMEQFDKTYKLFVKCYSKIEWFLPLAFTSLQLLAANNNSKAIEESYYNAVDFIHDFTLTRDLLDKVPDFLRIATCKILNEMEKFDDCQ